MDKHYVTFGEFQFVTVAKNPTDACVKAFKSYLEKDNGDTLSLPPRFRVSNRGFERHHDDHEIRTAKVTSILDQDRNQD